MKKNKKSKSNIEYWEDREVQKLKGQMKDLNKLEKLLRKEYAKASKEINNNIMHLFIKYMEDNELTYAQANQLLTSSEYKEWRMDLKDYIKLIEETGDPQLLLELNTLAMKSRITRLEEMFYQVDKQVNDLYSVAKDFDESYYADWVHFNDIGANILADKIIERLDLE